MGDMIGRVAPMLERLRTGTVLMALCAALWVAPGLALLLPVPSAARWALMALLLLAESFLLGVFIHDGDEDDEPLVRDCGAVHDEWLDRLPYGAGGPM